MRVLIIDDERSIRTSTMVAIQAAGHQAETADSGQVAVLKLEEDAYDLAFLICDLAMKTDWKFFNKSSGSLPNCR